MQIETKLEQDIYRVAKEEAKKALEEIKFPHMDKIDEFANSYTESLIWNNYVEDHGFGLEAFIRGGHAKDWALNWADNYEEDNN